MEENVVIQIFPVIQSIERDIWIISLLAANSAWPHKWSDRTDKPFLQVSHCIHVWCEKKCSTDLDSEPVEYHMNVYLLEHHHPLAAPIIAWSLLPVKMRLSTLLKLCFIMKNFYVDVGLKSVEFVGEVIELEKLCVAAGFPEVWCPPGEWVRSKV